MKKILIPLMILSCLIFAGCEENRELTIIQQPASNINQDLVNGNLTVKGELNVSGIAGDGSGEIVCIRADGNLGTCTVGIVGVTCTCA